MHTESKNVVTTCVICLEDVEKDDKTVQFEGCSHKMHSKCFFDHANYILKDSRQVLCPTCRHIVINVHPPSNALIAISPLTALRGVNMSMTHDALSIYDPRMGPGMDIEGRNDENNANCLSTCYHLRIFLVLLLILLMALYL